MRPVASCLLGGNWCEEPDGGGGSSAFDLSFSTTTSKFHATQKNNTSNLMVKGAKTEGIWGDNLALVS